MTYYICEHDLKHESGRHECDGCCSRVILIDKNLSILINKTYDDGVEDERKRLLGLIEPHLEVCNYTAVYEEECDVCYWVESLVDEILAIEREDN